MGAFLASLVCASRQSYVFFEVVSILFLPYLEKNWGRVWSGKGSAGPGRWDPTTLTCEVVQADGISREMQVARIQPGARGDGHCRARWSGWMDLFVKANPLYTKRVGVANEYSFRPFTGDNLFATTLAVDCDTNYRSRSERNSALH